MEKKKEILELRGRLDDTLALPELANTELVKSIVRNQILQSSTSAIGDNVEHIVEERTREVSNFLEMLRSASTNEGSKVQGIVQNSWKIKQDNNQLRVMYREGPHGTPFHTLLSEGIADGPIDVCLCVSWESTLYSKWFPQFNVPPFKIILSDSLKKVRIGEEISLVRVKVPWPLSEREALLHYFEIEYLKEGLILVLIKTLSDTEQINSHTHGFTRDGIPKAGETVRVDLLGGFALQRVDDNKTYFRAIANMDIKLDLVPPWFINFVARQLIGNGYKLYQKAVSSVAISDEEYKQALQGLLYTGVREYLVRKGKMNTNRLAAVVEITAAPAEEQTGSDGRVSGTDIAIAPAADEGPTEIVQVEVEDQRPKRPAQSRFHQTVIDSKEPAISPEVKHALAILDTAITLVKDGRFLGKTEPSRDMGSPSDTIANSREISRGNRNLSGEVGEFSNTEENIVVGGLQQKLKHNSGSTSARKKVHHHEGEVSNIIHDVGGHGNKSDQTSSKRNNWFCCLNSVKLR